MNSRQPSNPGNDSNDNGMQDLLVANKPHSKIASTETTTKILDEYKLKAALLNTNIAKDADNVPPEITERSNALNEANLRNLCTQAVI
eukprot:g8458.t1 g8458   contig3:153650-153913(+)